VATEKAGVTILSINALYPFNVWSGDLPDIRGRHLHPADVGGAIVSIDQPVPNGAWRWGGPQWVAHQDNSVVTSIAGVVLGAKDLPQCAAAGEPRASTTPPASNPLERAARVSTSSSWSPRTVAAPARRCASAG